MFMMSHTKQLKNMALICTIIILIAGLSSCLAFHDWSDHIEDRFNAISGIEVLKMGYDSNYYSARIHIKNKGIIQFRFIDRTAFRGHDYLYFDMIGDWGLSAPVEKMRDLTLKYCGLKVNNIYDVINNYDKIVLFIEETYEKQQYKEKKDINITRLDWRKYYTIKKKLEEMADKLDVSIKNIEFGTAFGTGYDNTIEVQLYVPGKGDFYISNLKEEDFTAIDSLYISKVGNWSISGDHWSLDTDKLWKYYITHVSKSTVQSYTLEHVIKNFDENQKILIRASNGEIENTDGVELGKLHYVTNNYVGHDNVAEEHEQKLRMKIENKRYRK